MSAWVVTGGVTLNNAVTFNCRPQNTGPWVVNVLVFTNWRPIGHYIQSHFRTLNGTKTHWPSSSEYRHMCRTSNTGNKRKRGLLAFNPPLYDWLLGHTRGTSLYRTSVIPTRGVARQQRLLSNQWSVSVARTGAWNCKSFTRPVLPSGHEKYRG